MHDSRCTGFSIGWLLCSIVIVVEEAIQLFNLAINMQFKNIQLYYCDTSSFIVKLRNIYLRHIFHLNNKIFSITIKFFKIKVPQKVNRSIDWTKLKKHLHTISVEEDVACRYCLEEAESAENLLCHCQILYKMRHNILGRETGLGEVL